MGEQNKELTAEQIAENWTRYRGLCEKLGDRSEAVLKMIDHLGERLALCPASSKAHFHNSFPGGLVEHSLRVFVNARKIAKAFEWSLPVDSLIISCLFHDLGKVGDHERDNYLPQTDAYWREKRGENYTYNKELPYMAVPLRGIFLLQHFGVKLSHDEMLAIYLNDGMYVEGNREYGLKEPTLATLVHQADLIATRQEKGLTD